MLDNAVGFPALAGKKLPFNESFLTATVFLPGKLFLKHLMASEEFKRGQRIISANEAAARAERLLPLADFGLTWGGLTLPSTEATTHFCVVGASGSGKTTLLRLLMQSSLPLIGAEFKEKPYEVDLSHWEEASEEEWNQYRKFVAQHKERISKHEAALQKNRDEIDRVREQNRQIWAANRSIRATNRSVAERAAEVDEELKGIRYSTASTLGVKVALAAIPVFVYLSPELFYFTPWVSWIGQISAQIASGLAFIGLFFQLINKSARRNKHNEKMRARQEALQAEKDRLAKREPLPFEPERDEPKRLMLPEIPPLAISAPEDKWVTKSETVEPAPYCGPGHRAMIYDAKGDIVSLLHGMQPSCPIEILNPFDTRATAWNLAEDITTPLSARQLAITLVPEEKNASQPFFANSARDIIVQVILALIHVKPGRWTLRDLILATQTREHLVAILEKTPQGKVKAANYFKDERTGSSILSEIATRMAPFEAVAQAWSHAKRSVSLKAWVESEYILVLGSNEEHRAAIDPINRVLFQRATELVLAQDESDARRTWFFLDEVRDAGNLESLGRLMTKGRSKGMCVVLGFQDIEGMHDAFGKERANEFIGQCANKAILRLNSPETAKWASELFGKYEFVEEETGENKGGSKTSGLTTTTGETTGETETSGTSRGSSSGTSRGVSNSSGTSNGGSDTSGQYPSNSSQWGRQQGKQTSEQTSEQTSNQTSDSLAKQKSTQSSTADNNSDTESWTQTVNKKRMEKDALLPSQFTTLPPPDAQSGMHGYYLLPSIGAFYGVLDSAFADASLLPRDPDQPNYVPRPDSEQYLQAWSTEEEQSLGLIPSEQASGQAAPEPAASSPVVPTQPSVSVSSSQTGSVPQADPDKVARLQKLLNRRRP